MTNIDIVTDDSCATVTNIDIVTKWLVCIRDWYRYRHEVVGAEP